jgi:hypothetical protein
VVGPSPPARCPPPGGPLLSHVVTTCEARQASPWRDGTSHFRFEPIEFVEKLAAVIPRSAMNLLLYHGALPPRACRRWQVMRCAAPPRTAPPASSRGGEAVRPPRARHQRRSEVGGRRRREVSRSRRLTRSTRSAPRSLSPPSGRRRASRSCTSAEDGQTLRRRFLVLGSWSLLPWRARDPGAIGRGAESRVPRGGARLRPPALRSRPRRVRPNAWPSPRASACTPLLMTALCCDWTRSGSRIAWTGRPTQMSTKRGKTWRST